MKKTLKFKLLSACLLLIAWFNADWAQNNTLSLHTTVPAEITVCDQAKNFSIQITNTGSKTAYQLRVSPGLPTGISYVPGSNVGMNQSLISGQYYFTTDSLPAGQSINVSYQATASCTSTSTGNLVSNTATATYLSNALTASSSETGGSTSYNLRWADLFYASITNQSFTGLPNQSYTRSVVIQNGGTGRLSSVKLTAAYASGITISGISAGTVVYGTNNYTVTLGAADFMLGGNHDAYFDQDEIVIVNEQVKINGCFEEVSTDYALSWGCNTVACQTVREEAKTLVGIGNPVFGTPAIVSHDPTIFGCGTGTIIYRASNSATSEQVPGASNGYNIRIPINKNSLVTFSNIYLNNQLLSTLNLSLTSGFINLHGFLTVNPDGPGVGLEDLDGDGFYDDLAKGQSFEIKIEYTLSGAGFSACAQNFNAVNLISLGIIGQNKCYANISTNAYRLLTLDGGPQGAPILDGPTDLVSSPGGSQIGLFTFQQPYQLDEAPANNSGKVDVIDCDAGYVQVKVIIPAGYEWVPGRAFLNGVLTAATQTGSEVLIPGGAYDGGRDVFNKEFGIELRPTCALPTGLVEIKFQMEEVCSSCATPIPAGCGSIFVQTHNECGGTGGSGPDIYLQTLSFEAQRNTFGWTNSSMTTQVNANSSGIALDRVYPCDSMKLITKGVVKGSNTLAVVDASLRINYQAPSTSALLDFGRATVRLYDASSGQAHTCSVGTPTMTNSGNQFFLNFDLNPCVLAHLDSLRPGDSVNMVIYMATRNEATVPVGSYLIPNFRARYLGYRSDNHSDASYDNWGTRMSILKVQHNTITAFSGDQVFSGCERATRYLRTTTDGGLGFNQDFPNEFRFTEDWGNEIVFTIPTGFNYVSGSSRYRLIRGSAQTLINTLTEPVYNPSTRTLTYLASATYANGWPQIEKRDDVQRFIQFQLEAEKCKTDQRNISLPVTYDQIQNASSPSESCKIIQNDLTLDRLFEFRQVEIDGEAILDYVSGYEQSFSWTIRLSNSVGISANNVWVSLQNLSGNIQITSIENVTSSSSVAVPFGFSGGYYMLNTGTLSGGGVKLLKITARSTNCNATGLDSLLARVGFSCSNITTPFDVSACQQDQFTLYFEPKPSNLQYLLSDAAPVDFCTPAEFDLDLFSSLPGNMYDVKVYMELPYGVAYTSGAYTYPLTGSAVSLPAPTAVGGAGTTGWNLTNIIPTMSGGFIGSRDTTRNKLDLDIKLSTSCGFDPASYVKFHITGVKNCGETVTYVAQKRITINGFPEIDSLSLALTSGGDISCSSGSSFSLTLVNQNDNPTQSTTDVQLVLPQGISYSGGSPAATVTSNLDGTSTLSWTQTPGLAAGASVTFVGSLSVTDPTKCGPFALTAKSSTSGSVYCAATGQSCVLTATTATAQTTINRVPLTATFALADTICLDQSATPVYVADCPVTHSWDFGDGYISTAASPVHVYAATGNYTVTHTVSNTCGSHVVQEVVYIKQCCPPNLQINLNVVEETCPQTNGGSITTTVGAGEAPYTFLWDDGVSTQNRSGLAPGVYGVTVRDAKGCTDYATVELHPAIDTIPPTITCPSDLTVNCVSAIPPLNANAASFTDNCPNPEIAVVESTNGGYACPTSPLEVYRTYTVTDASGNTASCTQTITVSAGTLSGGTCKGCDASMTVTFDCINPACVTVTSCKDLSNVVLMDCYGHKYKFDGLSGKTGYFCMPDGHPITTVWVKSGCFQSGDGPGYGRRFDHPCSPCAAPLANKSLHPEASANEQLVLEAFPNPFVESTTIEFAASRDATVSLYIYDMHGKQVAKLFEGEVKAGETYRNEFKPETPSAIYYVRLLDQNGVQLLQKLIQIR